MKFEAHLVRSSRPRSLVPHDLPIRLDDEEIAYLCLLRGIHAEIAALTAPQRAAFDLETESAQVADPFYVFKNDYVVVRSELSERYDSVRKGSSFWGRYLHDADAPVDALENFDDGEVILADSSFKYPTQRHAESVYKYASYGRPTDQFLFLYHFLELDFDREVVSRIKALDEDNLHGVGQIIRDLGGGDELSRLQHILREVEPSEVWDHASVLKEHGEVAMRIFYEYGKDASPLKISDDFKVYFLESSLVRPDVFSELKVKNSLNLDFAKNFKQNLQRCVAYWIYRIRCCVAHNKLGEYHLMTRSDMEFMEGFALPLLRSLVKHRMSRV